MTPAWSFACPDWEERLRERRSLVPTLPLNTKLADQAVEIFNALRLPDVPDQPAMAEAAGDWFRDIVRAGFGAWDPATQTRMINKIFALVPKKNSKTTGGAGIALTALLMNKRPNAELQMVGPTQEVANIAFDQAWGMIEADPEGYLQKRFQVRDHIKTIEDRLNGAELKIKTFDMNVATGSKPVFVLIDELHLMASMSYASRVFGQLQGGMLANPEALMVIITTQSDLPPAGVFKQELQYARGVRDGRIVEDVRTLPVLYEFPESVQTDRDKPWLKPENWPMVTPNLGKSVTLDRLIIDFRQANEKGEEEVRRWASQHLNVEIGMALHSNRWRGADHWEAAADPTLTLETLIERCEVAVVGIDGGGLDDLVGLAVLGRERNTRRWLHWGKAWVQADVLELRKDIAERLRDFATAKPGLVADLTLCQDVKQDHRELVEIVRRLNDEGLLPEKHAVGLDPVGVGALVDALQTAADDPENPGAGLTKDQTVAVSQGYRLSGAVWGAERKLKDGTLVHGGQPLMAWCVGNAKAEARGNAVLITKETAGKAKIDPLVALFNAADLMSRNPQGAADVMAMIG